jgi:hypothetical protein
MKTKILISIIFAFSLVITSCTKSSSEYVPTTANVDGSYIYNSTSTYYNTLNEEDFKGASSGFLDIYSATLTITPNIGWGYTLQISNLVYHGDTITFSIPMQQITVNNNTFNVTGNNNIPVGNYGSFDGFYTSNKIYFAYKSSNVETFEWVETESEGTKKN